MRPLHWLLVAALMLIAGAVVPAMADNRVALIIGNSNYLKASALPNPANDATAMSHLFERAGFKVTLRLDLGIAAMRTALRDFADVSQNADIAVVYFAGHGIEIDGNNYLIPVDAVLERDLDVDDETISLDRILRVLEPVKRLRLIILDACRENPFSHNMHRTLATRTIGRGLARVEPVTSDTLIAFAAKAGSIAADGKGQNSPFTAALLRHLAEPGLDLRIAFGRVRDQVLALTNNKQEPFVYGSLGGSVVTLIPTPSAPAPAPAAAPRLSPTEAAQIEITFWNSIRDTKNPALFEAYLRRYPNGAFAELAHIRLNGLKTATLTKPKDEPDARAPLGDPGLLHELRQRLYDLNFDPGPFDGPFGEPAHEAVREFEQQNNLPPTGVGSLGLLQRLRSINALKPWGAIVYSKRDEKWGMSWGEPTRAAAVAHARVSCGDVKSCPAEISFFGANCGAFAHSDVSWSIVARDAVRKARDAALADCRKRGKACQIIASVCANGADRFISNN